MKEIAKIVIEVNELSEGGYVAFASELEDISKGPAKLSAEPIYSDTLIQIVQRIQLRLEKLIMI